MEKRDVFQAGTIIINVSEIASFNYTDKGDVQILFKNNPVVMTYAEISYEDVYILANKFISFNGGKYGSFKIGARKEEKK